MTILFISRAYPPVTGGIENQNAALAEWLPKHAETTTVANRLGRRFLPFFMPYALLRALWLMRRHDVLLLGDGVLGIVGYCVKHCYPKKTVVSVLHGLDLTYTLPIYQRFWVKVFLPALDGFIAVGNRTIEVAVERGLRADRCIFVPNGVNTEKHLRGFPRTELEQLLVRDLSKCGVLLTSGRLAKRKGVAWFIRNVLPLLPPSVLYVVAGDGVDRENIQTTIRETSQTGRVFFLGYVNNRTRDLLFNTCDIFIQPNIHVDGDMEGFGLTVLEAGSCRLPVIAARLEGLKDAIIDGANGFLVEAENPKGYVDKINQILAKTPEEREQLGKAVRNYILAHYSWDTIADNYIAALARISETVK